MEIPKGEENKPIQTEARPMVAPNSEQRWYKKNVNVVGYSIPFFIIILLIVLLLVYYLHTQSYLPNVVYKIPGVSLLTTSATSPDTPRAIVGLRQ